MRHTTLTVQKWKIYIYIVVETSIIIDHYVLPLRSPPSILLLNFQLKPLFFSSFQLLLSNKLTTPRKIITSSERPWGPFLKSLACDFYRQFALESSLQKIFFLIPKIRMGKARVLVMRGWRKVKTQRKPLIS